MRLIDADELKTKVEAMVVHRVNESDYDFGRNQAFDYVADILIDEAPTIFGADCTTDLWTKRTTAHWERKAR